MKRLIIIIAFISIALIQVDNLQAELIDNSVNDNVEIIFHYDFNNGFVNLVNNQDESSIIEHSDGVVIEDGQLKLINTVDYDPRRGIDRKIDTSTVSKLFIEKRAFITPKGSYSLSSLDLRNSNN